MLNKNLKFTRVVCWINSKISNKDTNTTLMIFLFCHNCNALLWQNYWRSLMLWNPTSWSHLQLNIQMQLAFHPCDPFLINDYNMMGNSVEKCFPLLNVKLQVKLRFKTFCELQILLDTAFALNTNMACFAEKFSYPR